eukprot:GHVN01009499.1.p1 GENE.GHVN01009499.1~~GHVN01009499.1.p1  ORF type:complete len:253 (+),score=80.63 GHVN01009499.1:53-760(+)
MAIGESDSDGSQKEEGRLPKEKETSEVSEASENDETTARPRRPVASKGKVKGKSKSKAKGKAKGKSRTFPQPSRAAHPTRPSHLGDDDSGPGSDSSVSVPKQQTALRSTPNGGQSKEVFTGSAAGTTKRSARHRRRDIDSDDEEQVNSLSQLTSSLNHSDEAPSIAVSPAPHSPSSRSLGQNAAGRGESRATTPVSFRDRLKELKTKRGDTTASKQVWKPRTGEAADDLSLLLDL